MSAVPAARAFDVLIRRGLVIDGTGAEGIVGDVGIRDGRVASIGDLSGARAATEIDAEARVVAPGFIDSHGHSDFSAIAQPEAVSLVAQGVTTEIVGNCGGSAFPVTEAGRRLRFFPPGFAAPWTDASSYLDHVTAARPRHNVATLLGHGALRAAILGAEERAASRGERERLAASVADGLAAGAVGLSFGGHFAPSSFADADELAALCRPVAAADAVFASHLRDYGTRLEVAIDEALDVTGRAGARLHVSLLHAFGRTAWGATVGVLARIAAERARGRGVTCDTLAYPTVGAWWAPRAVFAEAYDWRRDDIEDLRGAIADPTTRATLRAAIEARRVAPKRGFDEEYMFLADWRDIRVVSAPDPGLRGRTIAAAAEAAGSAPVDTFLDAVRDHGRALVALHQPIDPADHDRVVACAFASFGTDGIATSPELAASPLNRLQQHPRHWGSFPHVLGTYVRERGLLRLPDAIRRMTSLPAETFRLAGRGVLRPGAWADVVVFDAATIGASGSWDRPCAYPAGIEAVIVNGGLAWRRGRAAAERWGQGLRRSDGPADPPSGAPHALRGGSAIG